MSILGTPGGVGAGSRSNFLGRPRALLGTPGWGQEVEANVLGFRVSPFVRDTSVRVTAAAI